MSEWTGPEVAVAVLGVGLILYLAITGWAARREGLRWKAVALALEEKQKAPGSFLADDDFSLASDLTRAAIEVGRNAEEHDIYLPEERGRYRGLSLRLFEHAIAQLQADAAHIPANSETDTP